MMADRFAIRTPDQTPFVVEVLPQIGGTGAAERLAIELTHDLLSRGLMTSQSWFSCDPALIVRPLDSPEVVAVILYREDGPYDAWITFGGVRADHRRRGLYGEAFKAFCRWMAANYPAVRRIQSGHGIANEASRAMHLARGSRPTSIRYVFDLHPPAIAASTAPQKEIC